MRTMHCFQTADAAIIAIRLKPLILECPNQIEKHTVSSYNLKIAGHCISLSGAVVTRGEVR